MALIIPANYDPHLTVRETQEAIKYIRDTFQKEFGKEMHLERISAPLFVTQSSGLNDNLNGVERPVQFDIAAIPGETVEVVHSLAKWKRMALKEYGFEPGEGLYTNMNAIRRDEELDNLHSCYVDQWDWEKVITKEDLLKPWSPPSRPSSRSSSIWSMRYGTNILRQSSICRSTSLSSPPRNWQTATRIRLRRSVKTLSPKNTAAYSL